MDTYLGKKSFPNRSRGLCGLWKDTYITVYYNIGRSPSDPVHFLPQVMHKLDFKKLKLNFDIICKHS
jgi:hypothetical protein